ncbi:unnamed protein product, partial [Symbiodinium natans]
QLRWGVLHATRIKFRSPSYSSSKWLSHHGEHLPLAPVVVMLETKGLGSILNSLECAFRQQPGAHVETLRQGQEFRWSSWSPQQVLDENHRQQSEMEMQRHREQAAEGRLPKPSPPPPAVPTPLNDPYAAPEVYAARPPPPPTPSPPTQNQPTPTPVTYAPPYPNGNTAGAAKATPKSTPSTPAPAPKASTTSPKPTTEIPAQRPAPAPTAQPGDTPYMPQSPTQTW